MTLSVMPSLRYSTSASPSRWWKADAPRPNRCARHPRVSAPPTSRPPAPSARARRRPAAPSACASRVSPRGAGTPSPDAAKRAVSVSRPQALEVRTKVRRVLVAQRAVLLQRLADDRLERRWRVGIRASGWHRRRFRWPPARCRLFCRRKPAVPWPSRRARTQRSTVRAGVQLFSRALLPGTCTTTVPSTTPGLVRCAGVVPRVVTSEAPAGSGSGLAWPARSRGAWLGPPGHEDVRRLDVSVDDAGLPWAASRASAIWMPRSMPDRWAAPGRRCAGAAASPSRCSITMKCRPSCSPTS